MTLVRRKISVSVTLGSGDFGDGASSNTVTLDGYRVSAQIVKGAAPGFDTADVRIWGLDPSKMNKVSLLGAPLGIVRNNSMTIMAGDDETGMALVFQGIIQNATQDFTDSPNVCINLGAQAGAVSAMAPVKPVSFQGSASVATLMTTVAASMSPPLTLENNGVSVTLANPYFSGTATAQMHAIAEAANIYAKIDGDNGVLAIWPKDKARAGQVVELSAESGLVGYPTFANVGIGLKALYFPGIRVGGTINLKTTSVPAASGPWVIMTLQYHLEAEMPGGAWFQEMTGYLPGSIPPQ